MHHRFVATACALAVLSGCSNFVQSSSDGGPSADATVTTQDSGLNCGTNQIECDGGCATCDVAGDASRLAFTCGANGSCVTSCASPYSSCVVANVSRCLDLRTDPYNCGTCERACGTSGDQGTCVAGQCVAKAVTSLVDTTGSLIVNTSNKIYFHDQKRIYRCDAPDCTNREPLYTSTFEALPLPQGMSIASSGAITRVYFLGKQSGSSTTSLVRCDLQNCVDPEVYIADLPSTALFGSLDSLYAMSGEKLYSIGLAVNVAGASRVEVARYKQWQPTRFAFSGDYIFDLSMANGIHRVARAACANPDIKPCEPQPFLEPSQIKPTALESRNEVLYFNDLNTSSIFSCPVAGCPSPLTAVATSQPSVESLYSDGSGLFWAYRSPNALADEIRACSPQSGVCAPSRVYAIASQQRAATQVRLGTKGAIYWFSVGADDSDAGAAPAIRRAYTPKL